MSVRQRTARRSGTTGYGTGAALALAGTMTTAIGIVSVTAAPHTAARPASLTLDYTCVFTGIGTAAVTMRIRTDLPSSLEVGDSSPRSTVTGVATVDQSFTQLAPLVGAKTMEGTVDGTATVSAPEGDTPLAVPMTIPRTPIPVFGAFDMTARGTAPAVTFTRQGTAKVVVGDLGLHLTPRDANGNTTAVNTMHANCTVAPGQNRVLQSIVVRKPARTTGPGTGGSGSGGTGSGGGTLPGAGKARPTSSTTPTPSPSPGTTGSVPPRSPSPSPGAPTLDTPRVDPTSTPDGRHGDPDPRHPVALALGTLVTGAAAAVVGLGARLRKRRAGDRDD